MPKHIVRLILLLIAFLVFAYAGIVYLTDPSFYRFGHYRADVVPELAAGEPQYRGTDSCKTCHADRHRQWSAGVHIKVKCEVCHGPAGAHPDSGKLPIPDNPVKLCGGCHEAMPARPDNQPQIVLAEHPYPYENPVDCSTCHNPHAPRVGAPETVVETTPPADGPLTPGPEIDTSTEPKGTVGTPLTASKCVACHGSVGQGKGSFPPLAGMDVTAFVTIMNQYKSGEKPSRMMGKIAASMSDTDIRELANYYAGLTGEVD
jgi:predicted CXXCH cytochrome family protein